MGPPPDGPSTVVERRGVNARAILAAVVILAVFAAGVAFGRLTSSSSSTAAPTPSTTAAATTVAPPATTIRPTTTVATTVVPTTAPWSDPETTTTTADPRLTLARGDVTIEILPEDPLPRVGERLWVRATARNTSADRTYFIDDGPAHGLDVVAAATEQVRPGVLPGSGPFGYRDDGAETFLTYVTTTRPDAVAAFGWTIEQLRHVDPPDLPTYEPLAPGASVAARFAVDLDTSAPLPADSRVFLIATASLFDGHSAAAGSIGAVISSVAVHVDDDPARLPSWNVAMAAVGRDRVVAGWIHDHQGPSEHRGCSVDTSFRGDAWEVEIQDVTEREYDQIPVLHVRVTPTGEVESIVERPINSRASTDPDAPGRAEDEVVLR